MSKWMYGLFSHKYRVVTLSTLYQTVSGIIIQSLKLIGQYCNINAYIKKSKKSKDVILKIDTLTFYIDYKVASLSKRYLGQTLLNWSSIKYLCHLKQPTSPNFYNM